MSIQHHIKSFFVSLFPAVQCFIPIFNLLPPEAYKFGCKGNFAFMATAPRASAHVPVSSQKAAKNGLSARKSLQAMQPFAG